MVQSVLASHDQPVDDNDVTDDAAAVTSCKPRKLPSWLLAAATGGSGDSAGGEVKNKKESKRAKSPEEAPDSKVSCCNALLQSMNECYFKTFKEALKYISCYYFTI